MNEELATVLKTSEDPKELLRAAVELASSDQATDQELLLGQLRNQSFLNRLNTKEEYLGDRRRLRLRPVLEKLADNRAPSARETILQLISNAVFNAEGSRTELLIEATSVIRPAPPELVDYWDRHCKPEDGYTPLSILAMLDNDSAPALELFERKMLDSSHDEEDKIVWLRTFVVPRRNHKGLLQTCEKLLKGALSSDLKSELVDVLFDYKPAEWYSPAEAYEAPPIATYGTAARLQLRAIGKYVLEEMEASLNQQQAVRDMLDRLERKSAGESRPSGGS